MRFLLALCCFIPAAAAGPYDTQRAQANLASDYATCAAFYMVTTVLTDNSKRCFEG